MSHYFASRSSRPSVVLTPPLDLLVPQARPRPYKSGQTAEGNSGSYKSLLRATVPQTVRTHLGLDFLQAYKWRQLQPDGCKATEQSTGHEKDLWFLHEPTYSEDFIDLTFRFITKFNVSGTSCSLLQRREPILIVVMVSICDALRGGNRAIKKKKKPNLNGREEAGTAEANSCREGDILAPGHPASRISTASLKFRSQGFKIKEKQQPKIWKIKAGEIKSRCTL